MKEIVRIFSKYLVALVFIFSGFVKCVDPTGFAIKMEDYLIAFGLDFLIPLTTFMSILMCGAELLVGVMILFNIKIKWAIWMAVALMVFFTPLTLWLAITNKVTDCGCFGDALVLTNMQTFLKNVVLDIFIAILFINRNRYKDLIKPVPQLVATAVMAFLVYGFEFYNLNRLPVIDFMPFKIGSSIPEKMVVPPGTPKDSFNVVLEYKKDGVVKEFTLQNYPANDSTWEYVDTKSEPVRVTLPLIHDFIITTPDGQDVTDVILTDPGYSMLVIYQSFKKANLKNIGEINRLANHAFSKGYKVYGLTASVPEEFEAFKEKAKASYPMYNMDETTLKTMIRANPGVMLIRGGIIMGKWNHKQVKKLKDI